MKIGFITPDDLSTLIFCTQFADEFKDSDDVEMVTVSSVGDFAKDLDQLPTRHVPIDMYRFVNLRDDLRYFWSLRRIFNRERFDVILTFTTKPNVFGVLAARSVGIPFIGMAVRGLGRAFEPGLGLKNRLVNRIVRRMYALASFTSDLVWFTSKSDQDHFIENGMVSPSRTLLTRNAVNLRTYAPDRVSNKDLRSLRAELQLREDEIVVVMVARLIWSKGVREFSDAAAKVRSIVPQARFLLVAPPEPNSEGAIPVEWIQDRVQAGDIEWLGFRKDVLTIYALSDIAVLPSYYNEGGYPRALLEPMALGKPVIAADTPVCRGPVVEGENGFLVRPRDTNSLVTAICRLLKDPDLRQRFGEASLHRIREHFDDRQVARKVLDTVRSGLSNVHGERV